MAVWLSLNFDIGYAVPDPDSNERVINDYYGKRTIFTPFPAV